MNNMEKNAPPDVYRELENVLGPSIEAEQKRNNDGQSPTAGDAAKSMNDRNKDTSATNTMESLPPVLYLKKVVQQNATGPISATQEPIPKLIVSTKSIKFDAVRYITLPPKSAEPSDPVPIKQSDAIKSTKIIIKGITSQDKRLMVCESPTTTEPLVSPQTSPTVQSPKISMDSSRNESKEMSHDDRSVEPMDVDERSGTPETLAITDGNDEIQPTSNTSTPRTNREMKQLQKTLSESKVLKEFVTDASRRLKRQLNETEDGEGTVSATPDASQKNDIRSHSLSATKETKDSISVRRNTRSLNAEFSAKQRKFLAGIQKHSQDSDEEHSDDDERGRGRRKIRKSGKLFPPLKVSTH